MPNVLNMLPAAVAQDQTRIFAGVVSTKHRAPLIRSDPLFVEVDWNPNVVVEIDGWSSGGASFPQQGDDVLIIEDDSRQQRCIWWSGSETIAHTAARAWANAALAINGDSKVTLDTLSFDEGNNFDVEVNFRYNVPVRGVYQVVGQVSVVAAASAMVTYVSIRQNGSEVSRGERRDDVTSTSTDVGLVVSDLLNCSTGDYIELWVHTSRATTLGTPNLVSGTGGSGIDGLGFTNYMSVAKILS